MSKRTRQSIAVSGRAAVVSFSSERDLQDVLFGLERPLADPTPYSRLLLRREQPVGASIPDLVYVGFLSEPPDNLWPARWTFQHACLVWQLRKRPRLQPRTIARRVYQRAHRVEDLLQDLERSGAVRRLPTGAVQLSQGLASVRAEVVAVEAKLTRWRDALGQASNYAQFADQAIVAMPSGGIPEDPTALKAFRSAGVGLCGIEPDGRIDWVCRPRAQTPTRGGEREFLIASATDPYRQTPWELL